MPDYPFKINVSTKNGTQNAWYDVDFADDTDTIVSASAIVTRINNMNRATTYSEDDTLSGVTSPNWGGGGGSVYLSASYTEPNTGSIVFTDTETSTNDGLDYYMFWGTKVCATLGLPEGIRIYTENFKLSDDSDDPDNYLSGDIIADGMAVKKHFKMAPQARMKSNVVWDEVFGEGLIQWVSGSSTELRMGYDDQDDQYMIRGNGYLDIIGCNQIGTSTNPIASGSYVRLDAIDIDMKSGGTKMTIGETTTPTMTIGDSYGITGDTPTAGKGNLGGIYIGSQAKVKMTCGPGDGTDAEAELSTTGLYVEYTNTNTFANTNTDTMYQLVLRNGTDTDGAFSGLAFQCENGFNADRLNAAILAERVDNGAGKVDSDLIFATNSDADDDLTERLRITSDGYIGIGTTTPGGSTGAIPYSLEIAGYIGRTAHHVGGLVGGYNNIEGNAAKSNPIYVIGSNYQPTDAALSNMYGIGYCKTDATFINNSDTGWGMYVAADGDARVWIAATDGAASYFDAGAVGIGTTSPAAKFEVVSAGNRTTPVARIVHSEATLDTGDVVLDLDFDDDQSITSTNYFILFQNQDGTVGSVNTEVAYSTFTGAHISQRPSGSDFSNWKPGMVVKSTGNMIQQSGSMSGSLSMAWPIVDITTTQKDKAIMGVFTSTTPAPVDNENYTTSSKFVGRIAGLDDNAPAINYNAVGEGKVLVTDTNGNIETGDYICSSARTGHGEKQDEVYLANFTVAKATQPYNFTSASNDADLGYKSVLIACTYHSG